MSLSSKVFASDPWNDTGFDLSPSGGYLFGYQADPVAPWKDAMISCDPATGHDSVFARPLKKFCRARGRNYFVLIGCIDKDYASCFPVLDHRELPYCPPRAGRLWVFANDVPGFYWNNSGRITLSIETTKQHTNT